MKRGKVYKRSIFAGFIWEDENGYHFQYDPAYVKDPVFGEVSKTLPVRDKIFNSEMMIPFFDGLIPEGWLLEIAIENWKLDPRDRMTLLLTVCEDNIGDVSIKRVK